MSNAASSNKCVELEGAIVSLILPPPRYWFSLTSMVTYAAVNIVVLFALHLFDRTRANPWSSAISVGIGGLLGAVVGFIAVAMIQRWQFRRRESELRTEEARLCGIEDPRVPLARIMFELEKEIPGWSFARRKPWLWSSLLAKLDAADLGRPRTLVDERHTGSVAMIDLPEGLLEPETIATGAGAPAGCLVGFLVFMLVIFAFVGIATGSVVYLLVGLLCLATILPLLPAVRRRLPWVTDRPRLPVAGVGFVRDIKGRGWTVNDAIMLVKSHNQPVGIRIELIGEAGLLTFAFADETDPEFIKLWQRWNHPHPRPELLG